MKNYEALELQAKVMRLVEGTELEWRQAIRIDDNVGSYFLELEKYSIKGVKLALAIVEGKPVFNGDKLLSNLNGREYTITHKFSDIKEWSWNPPKPRTVMVELLVEDAEFWSRYKFNSELNGNMQLFQPSNRFYAACSKALEAL